MNRMVICPEAVCKKLDEAIGYGKNKIEKKIPVRKLIKRDRYLLLMVAPCVLYFLLFHYAPMVWNIVAFQDYNVRKGIFGSSWVGLENFKRFF